MITKRIIPCLDVKDGRVVKGVNFAGLQDMADPVEMARYYNACRCDCWTGWSWWLTLPFPPMCWSPWQKLE